MKTPQSKVATLIVKNYKPFTDGKFINNCIEKGRCEHLLVWLVIPVREDILFSHIKIVPRIQAEWLAHTQFHRTKSGPHSKKFEYPWIMSNEKMHFQYNGHTVKNMTLDTFASLDKKMKWWKNKNGVRSEEINPQAECYAEHITWLEQD